MIGKIGAGEGNRTLVFSLEGCCSTIELHPRPGDLTRRPAGLNRPAGEPSFGIERPLTATDSARIFKLPSTTKGGDPVSYLLSAVTSLGSPA